MIYKGFQIGDSYWEWTGDDLKISNLNVSVLNTKIIKKWGFLLINNNEISLNPEWSGSIKQGDVFYSKKIIASNYIIHKELTTNVLKLKGDVILNDNPIIKVNSLFRAKANNLSLHGAYKTTWEKHSGYTNISSYAGLTNKINIPKNSNFTTVIMTEQENHVFSGSYSVPFANSQFFAQFFRIKISFPNGTSALDQEFFINNFKSTYSYDNHEVNLNPSYYIIGHEFEGWVGWEFYIAYCILEVINIDNVFYFYLASVKYSVARTVFGKIYKTPYYKNIMSINPIKIEIAPEPFGLASTLDLYRSNEADGFVPNELHPSKPLTISHELIKNADWSNNALIKTIRLYNEDNNIYSRIPAKS
jgi:hypothetical protein